MSIYFLNEINNKIYPKTVDNKEPVNTPILTPSIYCKLSANAKFPTKRLIVKPIPVNTETPYKLNQLELLGASANLNLIDHMKTIKHQFAFQKIIHIEYQVVLELIDY